MTISKTLLSPENTLCNLSLGSKKALLEYIAKHMQQELPLESWETIFHKLVLREKVGTTGFGNGIAIPHCRLESCTQAIGFFTRLNQAIDFEAMDSKPVDLVFTLIVPQEASDEHLEILSLLASIFNKNSFRISLRDCSTDSELFKRINKMLGN